MCCDKVTMTINIVSVIKYADQEAIIISNSTVTASSIVNVVILMTITMTNIVIDDVLFLANRMIVVFVL